MHERFHVRFSVPLMPVAKARPRHNTRTGVTYTPARTERFERDFALAALPHQPRPKLAGPVHLGLRFVFPARSDSMGGEEWAVGKPDLDNLEKSVMDALESWWVDDSLVVSHEAVKIHAPGIEARIDVEILSLDRRGYSDRMDRIARAFDAPFDPSRVEEEEKCS